jgi:hypothetical protein
MTERTLSEFRVTLLALAGESEIHPTFIMEDDELPELIKSGLPFDELLDLVAERF